MLILDLELSLLSRAPHHFAEQNRASLGTASTVEYVSRQRTPLSNAVMNAGFF